MNNHLIREIADRMSRKIPKPALPKARPAKSWRRLKPGQSLVCKGKMVLGISIVQPGTDFTVHRVDSLGADLISDDKLHFIFWTDAAWERSWDRKSKKQKPWTRKQRRSDGPDIQKSVG